MAVLFYGKYIIYAHVEQIDGRKIESIDSE